MATVSLGTYALDNGLNGIQSTCNNLYVCSAGTISDFSSASSLMLGSRAYTAGTFFGAPAAGSGGGRVITSVAISDGTTSSSGTVAQWAAVDTTNSRALAWGSLTGGRAISIGQTWTLGAIPIHMLGTSASPSYTGPGDVATFVHFYGLRAVTAAYATALGAAVDVVDATTGTSSMTIHFDATGALNATELATAMALAGGPVASQWYDQVGTEHLGTPYQKVALSNSPLSFHCYYDGSNNHYFFKTFASALTNPFGIHTVVQNAVNASGSGMIGNNAGFSGLGRWTSGQITLSDGGTVFGATASEGAFHVVQAIASTGSSSIINIDSTPTSGNAGTVPGWAGVLVGADGNAGAGNLLIRELGFMSGATSINTALDTNARTYWSI